MSKRVMGVSTSRGWSIRASWRDRLISWVFPSSCVGCLAKGTSGVDLCDACLAEMPVLGDVCLVCANHLPRDSASGRICGSCLVCPPAFARTFAAFSYATPVDAIMRRLKFGRQLPSARILGRLLAAHAESADSEMPDRFVPIPLHRRRMQWRGFNQAVEIARVLSHQLCVPFDRECLQKARFCVPQTALSQDLRRRGPRGMFAIAKKPRARFVAIVDDVMTTGATVNEAAWLLRKAGVERVDVWVVARTRRITQQ